MNKRERVKRAIAFQNPDRTPVWRFNKDCEEGDILCYDFRLPRGGNVSEWGYIWETLDDGTMGQPLKPVIPNWDDLENWKLPLINAEARLAGIGEFMEKSPEHYRLPMLTITGFTTYTFLRGFENAMIDFIEEPEKSGILLDKIFGFEKELITLAAEAGFDGFHFGDDWGTQDRLILSPVMWREIFKPRYKALFEHAHKLGLDVWFHSCGCIGAIAEDFNEIGADVLNIAQPNVVDLREIGEQLRGKQCFLLPVSYQTVSISGTREEIFVEAKRMYDLTAAPGGGFIGYVEEYGCMGMTDENYRACAEAFEAL